MLSFLRRLFSSSPSPNPMELFYSVVPEDANVVLQVLLDKEDLIASLVDHLGEGAALGRLAAVCRTFRLVVHRKRREWSMNAPEAFQICQTDASKFSHFVVGIAPQESEAILVSDSLNGKVYRSERFGESLKGVQSMLPLFQSPYQIATDGVHAYVADNRGKRLIKIGLQKGGMAANLFTSEWPPQRTPGVAPDPFGVAYAPSTASSSTAIVFVTDREAGRVCVFDAAALRPLFAFGDSDGEHEGESRYILEDPLGCCFHNEVLYVADRGNARIVLFDRTGRPLRTIGGKSRAGRGDWRREGGLGGPGTFLGPCGVVCLHGLVLVIDSMGVRGKVVQAFDSHFESPRLWLRLPFATRLVGIGSTNDALYVCDMKTGREAVMYRAAWKRRYE